MWRFVRFWSKPRFGKPARQPTRGLLQRCLPSYGKSCWEAAKYPLKWIFFPVCAKIDVFVWSPNPPGFSAARVSLSSRPLCQAAISERSLGKAPSSRKLWIVAWVVTKNEQATNKNIISENNSNHLKQSVVPGRNVTEIRWVGADNDIVTSNNIMSSIILISMLRPGKWTTSEIQWAPK